VVSNASLQAKASLLQIQRDTFQVVSQYFNHKEPVLVDKSLHELEEKVNEKLKNIELQLNIIEKNILGDEGKALAKDSINKFEVWKLKHNQLIKFIELEQSQKLYEHMNKVPVHQSHALNESLNKVYVYAKNKADTYSVKIESDFEKAHRADIISGILITFIFLLIGVYTTSRVSIYVKQEGILNKALNEKNLQYEYAINGTKDGLWDWNLLDDSVFFSPNWKEMLGYKKTELENDFKAWQSLVHPEDIEQALANVMHIKKYPHLTYKSIHRLRHKDGHWVWILARGKTVFDDDNNPLRIIGFNTDITIQKEQQLALQELNKLINNVVDTIERLIFVKDKDFKYILCNEAFTQFVGKSKEEIMGKDDFSLFDAYQAEFFREHDALMFKKNEVSTNYEWVVYPDAKKRYLLTIKAPLRNANNETIGLVGISTDVTKHKQLEDELFHQQKLLKEAQKISRLGYWTLNAMEDSLVWSEEVYELFGYEPDDNDANLQMFTDSVHPEDRDRVLDEYSQSIENKTDYECKHKVVLPNKEISYVLEKAQHEYDDKGDFIRSIGTVQDITKETLIKLEVQEQEEIMIAQSRHAAMGEMIGMIAHQWRQPITTIAMGANNLLADLALETSTPENTEALANNIVEQTQYLSHTIEDFRNFFKPDKERSSIKLADVVDNTLTIIADSLKANAISLEIDIEDNIRVLTYERELIQVLINIIKNAKEALVDAQSKDPYINLSVVKQDDKIIIKICDNAGGIEKDNLSKIFDPYFTTKDEKTGTGLGLYMSKTIVEKHLLGILSVQSDEKGSCFIISLDKEDENG